MLKIKIGEVCDVYDGPHATPKKIDKGPVYLGIDAITDNGKLNPSGYNYLSEEDYKIWTKRVTPQYGDLVFSYEATLGRYALIPKDFYGCLGRRLAVVRPKDERINIKWLYYYFLSPEWSVYIANNTVKGSTVNRISIEDFPNFYIPLLERTEQDKIVKVLSAIDEKIDNNVNINDNLQSQLRLIYENMIAKTNSNQIKGNFVTVKEMADITTGKEDANFSTVNGKYKFFTCSNVPLQCDEYAFESSSILIAGNGDFNVKYYSGKFNAYQRTYVLTASSEYYAILYLACLYQVNLFKSNSSGSIVKFITKSDVENIPLFIPDDISLLQKLNNLLHFQEQNILENDKLIQLRDFLLPMLMNGQATIDN